MNTYLLETRDLTVTFGDLSILQSISFTIEPGECIALIGASGSGKSLTAKALLQLLPSSTNYSGEILWKGQSIINYSEKQFRSIRGKEIAIIFQNSGSALNPTMKIGCQIAEICREHNPSLLDRQVRQKILELLNEVGLSVSVYEQYPHHLSGGMQQRACIAIALAMSPELLIADEPTTALDPILQKQILCLLEQLQKNRSMSILFITHDLRLITRFCSRALIIDKGKIVESAAVRDLFANPSHPVTKKLIQSIPEMPKQIPAETVVTTL